MDVYSSCLSVAYELLCCCAYELLCCCAYELLFVVVVVVVVVVVQQQRTRKAESFKLCIHFLKLVLNIVTNYHFEQNFIMFGSQKGVLIIF